MAHIRISRKKESALETSAHIGIVRVEVGVLIKGDIRAI